MSVLENPRYDLSTGDVRKKLNRYSQEVSPEDIDELLDFQALKLLARGMCDISRMQYGVTSTGTLFHRGRHSNDIDTVLRFLSKHKECHVQDKTVKLLMCLYDLYEFISFNNSMGGLLDVEVKEFYELCTLDSMVQLKVNYDYIVDPARLSHYGTTNEELTKALENLVLKVSSSYTQST